MCRVSSSTHCMRRVPSEHTISCQMRLQPPGAPIQHMCILTKHKQDHMHPQARGAQIPAWSSTCGSTWNPKNALVLVTLIYVCAWARAVPVHWFVSAQEFTTHACHRWNQWSSGDHQLAREPHCHPLPELPRCMHAADVLERHAAPRDSSPHADAGRQLFHGHLRPQARTTASSAQPQPQPQPRQTRSVRWYPRPPPWPRVQSHRSKVAAAYPGRPHLSKVAGHLARLIVAHLGTPFAFTPHSIASSSSARCKHPT